MFELLTLFLTGGGSAAMGSILKGVFGAMVDARQQKYELEMMREARNNDYALKFQETLTGGEGGAFVRGTRRMLAVIGMCTLSAITLLTTVYPSVPILTTTNIDGEGRNSYLWGLIDLQASQANMAITSGHISLFAVTCIYPLIVGFYFTPGGRR